MKSNKEKPSLIVADDLQFSREMIKSSLLKSGFKSIRTADSGQQTIKLLSEEHAEVVLADFWMPGMNGLELTRLIRRWDEYTDRYTGIVLLTGEEIDTSIKVAFEQGVDEFVTKSAHLPELAARIQGAARIARMQNQLRSQRRQLGKMLQGSKPQMLKDEQSGLIDRIQFIEHLDRSIQQNIARAGKLAVCLIQVDSLSKETAKKELPGKVLRSISTSLQLVLRPLDIICRFNQNSFAICFNFPEKETFDPGLSDRLQHAVFQQYRYISKPETELTLNINFWHEKLNQGHSAEQIITYLEQLS